MLILANDAVEEGHWRADACHLVFIILDRPVVLRIRRATGVLKGVDQRVQSLPDRDQSLLVLRHQNGLLLAEEVREALDDCQHTCRPEQNVEEAVTHVRQVIVGVGALYARAPISDRLAERRLNLADDLEDDGFEQVG